MATIGKNTDAALEVSNQAEYVRYLTEAPIVDFANYAGIDIDEAVNRRVAAAVEAAPLKVEVSVKPIEPRGKLIGVADVRFGGGIVVEDFKLFNGDNGLWVGPPSKPDNTTRSGFRRTARITDDRVQAALDNGAIYMSPFLIYYEVKFHI